MQCATWFVIRTESSFLWQQRPDATLWSFPYLEGVSSVSASWPLKRCTMVNTSQQMNITKSIYVNTHCIWNHNLCLCFLPYRLNKRFVCTACVRRKTWCLHKALPSRIVKHIATWHKGSMRICLLYRYTPAWCRVWAGQVENTAGGWIRLGEFPEMFREDYNTGQASLRK